MSVLGAINTSDSSLFTHNVNAQILEVDSHNMMSDHDKITRVVTESSNLTKINTHLKSKKRKSVFTFEESSLSKKKQKLNSKLELQVSDSKSTKEKKIRFNLSLIDSEIEMLKKESKISPALEEIRKELKKIIVSANNKSLAKLNALASRIKKIKNEVKKQDYQSKLTTNKIRSLNTNIIRAKKQLKRLESIGKKVVNLTNKLDVCDKKDFESINCELSTLAKSPFFPATIAKCQIITMFSREIFDAIDDRLIADEDVYSDLCSLEKKFLKRGDYFKPVFDMYKCQLR